MADKIRKAIAALVSQGFIPGVPGRQTIDVWTGEKMETFPITYENGQFVVWCGGEMFSFEVSVV